MRPCCELDAGKIRLRHPISTPHSIQNSWGPSESWCRLRRPCWHTCRACRTSIYPSSTAAFGLSRTSSPSCSATSTIVSPSPSSIMIFLIRTPYRECLREFLAACLRFHQRRRSRSRCHRRSWLPTSRACALVLEFDRSGLGYSKWRFLSELVVVKLFSEPVNFRMAPSTNKDVRLRVLSDVVVAPRLASASAVESSVFDVGKLEPVSFPTSSHIENTPASAFLAEAGHLPVVPTHNQRQTCAELSHVCPGSNSPPQRGHGSGQAVAVGSPPLVPMKSISRRCST